MNEWKKSGLVILKPTLSSNQTLVFWVHESILSKTLKLTGIRGGFKVNVSGSQNLSSAFNAQKKTFHHSPRVLLDLGCDSSEIITKLCQCGLEDSCVWDFISDLYHYELIQECQKNSFDFLVSKNERLFTPSEEWMQYLLPRKTKLMIIPLKDPRDCNYAFNLINQDLFNEGG